MAVTKKEVKATNGTKNDILEIIGELGIEEFNFKAVADYEDSGHVLTLEYPLINERFLYLRSNGTWYTK